jgi:hypothetical protein
MNPIDLLIIYLACGAPFGVYYFLQRRAQSNSISLWLKTLFNFLFWMPFALHLLRRQKTLKTFSVFKFDKTTTADSIQTKHFRSIQKQIEKILLTSDLKISIYEFREIIERYVGLSLAAQSESETTGEQEKEIFRAARMKNVELGAICLKRRNRKRLSFHQTEARRDFLHLINQLNKFDSKKDELQKASIELVKTLNDLEAQKELENLSADSPQTGNQRRVHKLEKDIWKSEIHRPLPARITSAHIQAMKAMANSRRKD